MNDLMIKVDNISKEYRLGLIGGTTLKEELQRRHAKRRHLEDPTLKIGQQEVVAGTRFNALSGVSFSVGKGEAVGIIGHNGAGKSTLLKLITRITAPTEGQIYLNGKVASMLEVGTGFHPELTGRENIYLNGAILGMKKHEIDEKMDEIIEFSECKQFIDTPVKRYSSGMYVKLAFSVASHLDSEIMIMDEVLAVGDVAFQNKCIQKMKDVANSGKTILYVSHNMATIRSLCTRCIVLNHGKVEYDGDVEEAITHYVAVNTDLGNRVDLSAIQRPYKNTELLHMNEIIFLAKENCIYQMGEKIRFELKWSSKRDFTNMSMRIGVFTINQIAVGLSFSEKFSSVIGENVGKFELDTSALLPGKYCLELIMQEVAKDGSFVKHDVLGRNVIPFEIMLDDNKPIYRNANSTWGNYALPLTKVFMDC